MPHLAAVAFPNVSKAGVTTWRSGLWVLTLSSSTKYLKVLKRLNFGVAASRHSWVRVTFRNPGSRAAWETEISPGSQRKSKKYIGSFGFSWSLYGIPGILIPTTSNKYPSRGLISKRVTRKAKELQNLQNRAAKLTKHHISACRVCGVFGEELHKASVTAAATRAAHLWSLGFSCWCLLAHSANAANVSCAKAELQSVSKISATKSSHGSSRKCLSRTCMG